MSKPPKLDGVLDAYRRLMLESFLSAAKKKCRGSFFVLVTDQHALRYVTNVLTMKEISKAGVSLIELLHRRRKPLPTLDAAYLLMSTEESVQMFLAESPSQYSAFHLFFLSRLEEDMLHKIKANKDLMKKVKTLFDLHAEFLVNENNAFSLGMPAAGIPNLWGSSAVRFKTEAETSTAKLSDVCSLMCPPGRWKVRYAVASVAARTVAQKLFADLKSRTDTGASAASYDDAVVLVLDRMADMGSPLVHEFTFQPMCHDLLELDHSKPGGCRYNGDGSDAPSESDRILEDEQIGPWKKFKHEHIAKVSTELPELLNSFVGSTQIAKIHQHGAEGAEMDVDKLRKALRELPGYQDELSRYAAMTNAAKDCMSKFHTMDLDHLARIEQALITGVTADGYTPKSKHLVEAIRDLMVDSTVKDTDKLRLVSLAYVVSRADKGTFLLGGRPMYLASVTFRRRLPIDELVQLSGVRNPPADAVYAGLKSVAESCLQQATDFKLTLQRSEETELKTNLRDLEALKFEHEYDVSRYRPFAHNVAHHLVEGTLPELCFPFVSKPQVVVRKPKRLFMIFVVGGVTYSEIREIYNVSAEAEKQGAKVIIGGSSIITPLDFMEAIAGITNDTVRQRVLKPIPALDLEPEKTSKPPAQTPAQAPAARTGASQPKDAAARPPSGAAARRAPPPAGRARRNAKPAAEDDLDLDLDLEEVPLSTRNGKR